MPKRVAKTRFPFEGLPKGHVFEYDDIDDQRIVNMIGAGYMEDITPEPEVPAGPLPPTQHIVVDGIESLFEMGEIGGTGADQPDRGGEGSGPADDSPRKKGVHRNKGAGEEVAEGR